MTQSLEGARSSIVRSTPLLAVCIAALLSCKRDSSPGSTAPVVESQLVFTVAPGASVGAGTTIAPAVAVTAENGSGAPMSSFVGAVTLALGTNPGGATLSGTSTVSAVAGVATFTGISLNKAATGYTLVASATGLTTATSTTFAITPGAAATLAKSGGDHQSGPIGVGLATPPSVTVSDAYGNAVPSATVNWTAVTGGGSTGHPTSTTNAVGVASIPWTLGTTLGSQTATGAVASLAGSPATFTATATPFAFTTIAAGFYVSCGLTGAGAAFCWGYNGSASLGAIDPALQENTAVAVQGGLTFTRLVAGTSHVCGLTSAGAAYCWGSNYFGEAGSGDTSEVHEFPVPVQGGIVFASLSANFSHTCGLTAAGTAYCWGDNIYGDVGDGTTTQRSTPTLVSGGIAFTSLTTGNSHTCGLTAAGTAYCWGADSSGQLGDGTTTQRLTPTALAGGLTFANLTSGFAFTCGATTAGDGYCWGLGQNGQLGNGTNPNRNVPTLVAGGLSFANLVANEASACGLSTAGTAYCWGDNGGGELGNGSLTSSATPTLTTGGIVFASIAGGTAHTCALTAGGAAYCWGANQYGNIGDGTKTNRTAPTAVIP